MSQPIHDEDAVRLALLLKPAARSNEGRDVTARIAATLGLVETGRGAASISFRVSRVRFEQVFEAGVHAAEAGADELGATTRAGMLPEREPVVPAELSDYVDAVSVEPPAVMLTSSQPQEPT